MAQILYTLPKNTFCTYFRHITMIYKTNLHQTNVKAILISIIIVEDLPDDGQT